MNRPKGISKYLILAFVLCASFTQAAARSSSQHQYEVSRGAGEAATVTTSADREAVVVSVYRQGQLTHHYRAYPQVAAITVQLGEQRTLFTYYIETGLVAAENFRIDVASVRGPLRRQRQDVSAVRRLLLDDMHVLRAIRGYAPHADILLAELAYVVLTYDDSIIDGPPSPSLSVRETAAAKSPTGGFKYLTTAAAAPWQNTLDGCLGTCDSQYTECQGDGNVTDKTVCHTNRTNCTNNCYKVYGQPKVPFNPN